MIARREERLEDFPPVPCTPKKCTACGFTYHWAGKAAEVNRLKPVEEGKCPACWTGRMPAVHARPCPRCAPHGMRVTA